MRHKKVSIKQRGQMLVLFAIMVPVILLFVGLGIDVGWYYLNVSRLQNAADAAVIAGAKKLVDKELNEKMYKHFYANQGGVVFLTTPPTDLVEFDEIYYSAPAETSATGSTVDYSGNMNANNLVNTETKHEKINLQAGEVAAKEYTVKNLSSAADAANSSNIIDSWSTYADTKKRKVTLQTKLYATAMDVKETTQNNKPIEDMRYYYEVKLSEDIPHFFLSGQFKPMKAVVVAHAMLKPHTSDLVTSINLLEQTKVIANWEYQTRYFNYEGIWNHYRYSVNGQKRVSYKTGDDFRTETVNVQQTGGSGIPTSANHNNYYSEDEVDAINIDFNQDVSFSGQFTSDWDLGYDAPDGTTITYINKDGWTDEVGYDLRIQGLINLNYAWKNRKLDKIKSGNYTSDDLTPDILWTRIESDPIWSKMPWGTQNSLNSVHQMIINVNESNAGVYTFTDENGNEQKVYEKRPFFIFYMGPETNTENSTDKTFAEDTSVRKSQPVILNLNADFNGVLFAPNSPVIINGNGNTMRGFVIAKEYLKLKEDSDFTSKGYISAYDEYGHTIFVKQADTVSETDFENLSKNYIVSPDSNNGIYSLYETPQVDKYLVLRVTKAGFDAATHSIKNEFLSTTYKADLKTFRNITDDNDLATISFPDENNNNTLEEYPVVAADLSDTQNGTDFVKVLLHNSDGTTTEKYIDKKNLPYVKSRQNEYRPYICVYDIKKQKVKNSQGNFFDGYNGTTIQDYVLAEGNTGNNTKSDIDSRPNDNTYDYRSVKSDLMTNYKNNYVDSKLTFVTQNDCKYFMLTKDISTKNKLVAQYRKITHDGTTEYVKEKGATYYMKLVPTGSSEDNPIIVDNYGNLQVKEKPLSDSSWGVTRPTNSSEQPDDTERYKTLQDTSSGELKDYRDMKLEVVYKMQEAFNIAENYPASGDRLPSGYSYFQIGNLKRKNYKYMNVDELHETPAGKWHVVDMFFTTKRASWID